MIIKNKTFISYLFILFSLTTFCQDNSGDWWTDRAERLAVKYNIFTSTDFVFLILPYVCFFLTYIFYRKYFIKNKGGEWGIILFIVLFLIYFRNIFYYQDVTEAYKYLFLDQYSVAKYSETIGTPNNYDILNAHYETYQKSNYNSVIRLLIYQFHFLIVVYTGITQFLILLKLKPSDAEQPVNFRIYLTLIFSKESYTSV